MRMLSRSMEGLANMEIQCICDVTTDKERVARAVGLVTVKL